MDALSQAEKKDKKPENDDELWYWIKDNLGLEIPRIAVCPGHNAPFEPIADLFFERIPAAIVVANRGGGKTMSAALWQFLNMRFIPEVECLSMGAVEIQAKRAYSHFRNFQKKAAEDMVDSTLRTETVWKDGQKYEIITGSLASVNGPHNSKVHRDEIELIEDERIYQDSLQIEQSKTASDGTLIPAQTLVTSTRKTSDGLMQRLLDDCREAEANGRKPPYKVYFYCAKECIQNQQNCRVAFPDLPEDQKCDCDKIQNGEWESGEPRTFDAICQGAFARADGFTPIEDVQNRFAKSSKAMWDAQQECKRPYAEHISLEEFSRERHGIYEFEPDPENGLIFQGIDWGGASPFCALWAQLLDFEIEVIGIDKKPKRIPQGALVLFDELYIADIGNTKFADMIVDIERGYQINWSKFGVSARFADRQGFAARKDFRNHNPPLICSWPIHTRDRQEHFKHIKDRVVDNLLYFDIRRVEMLPEEIEVWDVNKTRKSFDHAVDAACYLCSNVHALLQSGKQLRAQTLPGYRKTRITGSPDQFNDSIPRAVPSPLSKNKIGPNDTLPEGEEWRAKFY